MRKIIVLSYILIMALILGGAFPAEAVKFILSPPRFEFTMPPGASTTEAIEITNGEDTNLELRAYLEDWSLDPRTGTLVYKRAGSSPNSCSSWVKVNPQVVRLGPRESRLVRFTITAPANTSGSYWTTLFFESRPTASQEKGRMGVVFTGRLGVIIYGTIAGTEIRSGKILDLKFQKDKENKSKLAVTFENSGNIHVRPKGTWVIKNEAGKKVAKGEIEEFLVLPKNQRVKEQTLEEIMLTVEGEKKQPVTLPPGKYTLAVELDYGAKDLVGGDLVFDVPAPPAPKTPTPPPVPGK